MGVIAWLVLGALSGWIANRLMGKNISTGLLDNIIIGIIGAFIGGFVFNFSKIPGSCASNSSKYPYFFKILDLTFPFSL